MHTVEPQQSFILPERATRFVGLFEATKQAEQIPDVSPAAGGGLFWVVVSTHIDAAPWVHFYWLQDGEKQPLCSNWFIQHPLEI